MVAKPRFLHTTVASVASHMLSHTVPHCVNIQISTLPSYCVEPPTNLICPLKLHCPPEIIGQVAYAYKFENSYTVYSIKIHCPWFLLAKCTTAWQDSHTSKRWHKKSRFILQIRRCTIKKNAAVEFVLRKLSNRGWSRRCTQTQTDTSLPILIAFQWLPAGGSLERG